MTTSILTLRPRLVCETKWEASGNTKQLELGYTENNKEHVFVNLSSKQLRRKRRESTPNFVATQTASHVL